MSADTWENYNVDGLDVTSVTGGDQGLYDKVVIMLHGGGGKGSDWVNTYNAGWFGDITGFKYVFPTAPFLVESNYGNGGAVWYESYKNGAGLDDDAAYNISSIEYAGSKVASLVNSEKSLVGGDASKVFLAGFSQGG